MTYFLKKNMDRKKSTTKMATSEMTTEAVVDSPTPFAPPVVVWPQPQLITDITPPNANPFAHITPMSKDSRYFAAESTIAFGEMPYRRSASNIEDAMPTVNEITESIGRETAQATTRGATR
jgi:hypothetical protein